MGKWPVRGTSIESHWLGVIYTEIVLQIDDDYERIGKTDRFIAVTCNPKRSEIKEPLDGMKPEDRPCIVARMFHLSWRTPRTKYVDQATRSRKPTKV